MDDLLEYEGLVYSIISKFSYRFDKEDLYQVGMMGLVEAYKHYDSSFNVKFSSYAYYYILGEVTRFIRENRSLKISKDVIKLNQAIEKTKEFMMQRLGREPTDLELALFMEIDESKISEVKMALEEVKSLDYTFDDDSCFYNSCKCYDKGMDASLIDLRDEIRKLPIEDQQLLDARYYQDLTQNEASKTLGMSQVQVSRREGKILEKLKDRL